jgi:hypothetical protein
MNESLKMEASDLDDLDVAPCDQWTEDRRSGADKSMPTGRVCKNTAMLGVKGMDDPAMASAMMGEWRRQMADEGKARPGTRSIGEEFAAQIADEKQS